MPPRTRAWQHRRMHLATQADIEAVESAGLDAHVPWTSVPQPLEAVAARRGSRPALSWHVSADPAVPGECWTHAELMFRVRQTANLLRSHGVDDDHAAALLLPAVPAARLTLLGGEAAGRVCPINLLLDAAHCAALLRAANARVLVALAPGPEIDLAAKVEALRAQCPLFVHVLRAQAPGRSISGSTSFLPSATARACASTRSPPRTAARCAGIRCCSA